MSASRGRGRRAYGTGTLRVVGGSWLASWYGSDGRRVQRKVGAVRTEGRADGLTKAQAERVLRRMREIESPRSAPDGQRVTMEEAGKEFCQRLELKGRRKSHRLTVASDLANHIAPFFGGPPARSGDPGPPRKRAREGGILSDVQIMSQHRQIIRDRAKRGIVDLAQRYVPRLQTPMTQLLGSLRARAMLPTEMTALELFGMHGLWHTRDYAPHCRSLEFYEIDPVFAAYAARGLPNAEVVVGDSIQAVRSGTLKRDKYTFIVLDNPSQSPYGNGYIEHFDLFPQILRYIDDGVLVLNFLLGVHDFSDEQARRRKEVYGTVRPSVDGAAAVYERHFREAQLDVPTFTYTSRNAGNGYLAFVCQRPAGAQR